MRALRRFPVIALIVVFFAVRFVAAGELPTAKPKEVGLDADKIQQARDAVKALIDKKEIAGAVIAVARKGKVVMFEALGEAEAGSGKPMNTDSIVRIYSMTKPITTVAAMILVDEGKIGLDDPVSKYLPEFKNVHVLAGKADSDETVEAKRVPTIRDLMRHTAGLTYGNFGNRAIEEQYKKAGIFTTPGDSLQDTIVKLAGL